MDAKTRKTIKNMDYRDMLDLWINAPEGHPFFMGSTGELFAKTMKEKRDALGIGEQSEIQKSMNWPDQNP